MSNYNHGHKTDDDLFILYKGIKVPVTRVDWSGRKGTLTDSLEVITLVNGKRLVPSHFRYGFAEVPGNWLHWRMKLSYPAWMLKEIMLATSTLLASIPKDDTWKGAYLPIPFKDHDR